MPKQGAVLAPLEYSLAISVCVFRVTGSGLRGTCTPWRQMEYVLERGITARGWRGLTTGLLDLASSPLIGIPPLEPVLIPTLFAVLFATRTGRLPLVTLKRERSTHWHGAGALSRARDLDAPFCERPCMADNRLDSAGCWSFLGERGLRRTFRMKLRYLKESQKSEDEEDEERGHALPSSPWRAESSA